MTSDQVPGISIGGGRIAALDVGDKRVGIAVGDALGITAQPLVVVERKSTKRDVEKICEALSSYKISRVVVGLPLELDAGEGRQAKRVRAFGDAMEQGSGLEVVYQDERFTSAQSERLLVESGMSRKRRRGVIDKMAAALILQAYLDSQGSGGGEDA